MRSLRFRLTLWFSLAVTLTAGTAVAVGYFVVRRQMFEGIDFLLQAEIQEVLHRLGDHPERMTDAALTAEVQGHTEIDAPLYYFQIHRVGTGVIFRSRNLGDITLPDLSDGGAWTRTIQVNGEPLRLREQPFHSFHVQVATSLEQVEALIDRYQHAALFGLPLLFCASIGIGLVLGNIALAPVRAMQRSAQRISATNLAERLPVPPGQDEIAALARLLNALFARLETAFEQIRRFTADASHELKTPLSLIRLHAERLAQSPRLDESDRNQIAGQIEEIDRLNQLVGSLLLLARADAGSLPLDLRQHDTEHFLRDFSEDATALADERGSHFSITQNDAGVARLDAVMIRQVLLNILANAIRHTPPGGTISMRSWRDEGDWKIELLDDGPGVPPEQIERIFSRFVRGSNAESDAVGGSGLGLAIARSIVEAHGGTIVAVNRQPQGLLVAVSLPGGGAG